MSKLIVRPVVQESRRIQTVSIRSLAPPPLHYAVTLSAERRQRHRAREHDGNCRPDVPLQKFEYRVPPRP